MYLYINTQRGFKSITTVYGNTDLSFFNHSFVPCSFLLKKDKSCQLSVIFTRNLGITFST